MRRWRRAALGAVLPGVLWAGLAVAGPLPGPCGEAIAQAEQQAGIPAGLLGAMGVVESGRPGPAGPQPWPWTLNSNGVGQLFETAAEAVTAVDRLLAAGKDSVDVGCLQVNLRSHPNAFATLQDAFDPVVNVQYAARLLVTLHARRPGGNWMEAVGLYHSQTPDRAAFYRARVQAVLGVLDDGAAGALLAGAAPALPPPRPAMAVARAERARPGITTAEDWTRLADNAPRRAWRVAVSDALSPDRALALASALDSLARPRSPR